MSCNSWGKRRLILIAAPLALALVISCQNRPRTASSSPAPPARYAVLRFENLSGDAGLDWVGRAASESLPVMLEGGLDGPVLGASSLIELAPALGTRPASVPGISAQRDEALAGGANRIISGYIEHSGNQVRITASVENVSTGRTVRIVPATGAAPAEALNRLAHDLSARAGSLPVKNPEALQAWASALEMPSAEGMPLLEEATRMDPNAGPPWVALANAQLAGGDRITAENTINQARQHHIDDLSRARLDLTWAEANQDSSSKIAALRRIVALSPADLNLLRGLADSEIALGQFQQAAADWQKLANQSPNDPLTRNSLGYARSYARDYAGAMGAFHEYQRLRPQDANPSDSMGDLNYAFRKFKEAADNYLEAQKKQPGFQQYADLYKAAWAKFRAGDKSGADALFTQFRNERLKAAPADQVVLLLDADRLYRTGHQSDAFAALRKLAAEPRSPVEQAEVSAQLTVWDLLAGDRAQATQDAAAIGARPPTTAAFVARFVGQPSAPATEWEARAMHAFPLPQETGLRQTALGYALLLDGKREAALPVWEQIAKTAPGTDFFVRAIYAKLQGKVVERPPLPDPNTLNQFSALLDKI